MKVAMLESYQISSKDRPDNMLFRISDAYKDVEGEVEAGYIVANIRMADMVDMVKDCADESLVATFVHDALNDYADKHNRIEEEDITSFLAEYGYFRSDALDFSKMEDKYTPEQLGKALKKFHPDYISRLIAELKE